MSAGAVVTLTSEEASLRTLSSGAPTVSVLVLGKHPVVVGRPGHQICVRGGQGSCHHQLSVIAFQSMPSVEYSNQNGVVLTS